MIPGVWGPAILAPMSEDDLTAIPDRRAAHWRLKPETWAMVMAEYRGGATAPELAAKWRVSIHAIRKRITETKSAKCDHGDAAAVEQARGWDASRETARTAFRDRVFDLFACGLDDAEDTDDPGRLSRQAMMAAGRAMREGHWEEARGLLAFGEQFAKVAGMERDRRACDLESLPLGAVFAARFASKERVEPLFHLSDRPGVKDPDRDVKTMYWRAFHNHESQALAFAGRIADQREHIDLLKARIADLGGTEPAFDYADHSFRIELSGC